MADEKIWKPLDLIKVTADYLAGKSVPSPRLDAEVLLCEVMKLERRVDLYACFEREVSDGELAAFRDLVRRRAAREPVSRILGRREFMGVAFLVTPDVLSPRPETELLVEAAIEAVAPKKIVLPPDPATDARTEEETQPEIADAPLPEELERLLDSYAEDAEDDGVEADRPPKPAQAAAAAATAAPGRAARKNAAAPRHQADAREIRALDLGTGSGCIAVSLAAHLPAARVVALDASPKALAVAKKNAETAGVSERVEFRRGDWFAGCRDGEKFDLILSNPPYLVEGDPEIWPEVARYDPPAALYGGKDGLDCYRRIIPDLPERLFAGGRILLEVGAGQAGAVADMLRRRGFRDVEIIRDYGGFERVVKATL